MKYKIPSLENNRRYVYWFGKLCQSVWPFSSMECPTRSFSKIPSNLFRNPTTTQKGTNYVIVFEVSLVGLKTRRVFEWVNSPQTTNATFEVMWKERKKKKKWKYIFEKRKTKHQTTCRNAILVDFGSVFVWTRPHDGPVRKSLSFSCSSPSTFTHGCVSVWGKGRLDWLLPLVLGHSRHAVRLLVVPEKYSVMNYFLMMRVVRDYFVDISIGNPVSPLHSPNTRAIGHTRSEIWWRTFPAKTSSLKTFWNFFVVPKITKSSK